MSNEDNKLPLGPGHSLEELYLTLSPKPLLKEEEFNAFYRPEINYIRGEDKIAHMALGLNRAWKALPYKAFLMGHPGVGKSTELTRLLQKVKTKFSPIRFSILSELNPVCFQPFDILLLIMTKVAEKMAAPTEEGGIGEAPSDARLREIWSWFATETNTHSETKSRAGEVSAGAGIKEDSLLNKVLGLFANIKGEIKYGSVHETKKVEYRMNQIYSLLELVNRLLIECNEKLLAKTNRELLIIGEDFDKPGVPVEQIKNLFITFANIFRDLQANLIFTIPIGLGYSEKSVFLIDQIFVIPDTPVYQQDHTAHNEGRAVIEKVLAARVSIDLFEEHQMMRAIVASGGNLRDLFSIVSHAADNAILRGAEKISHKDVEQAINNLRSDYERRLGTGPYDDEKLTYDDKVKCLLDIYNQKETAKVPNAALYSLLRARAVQEFNGKRWFGVHPLVVDILKSQGALTANSSGEVPGGIE